MATDQHQLSELIRSKQLEKFHPYTLKHELETTVPSNCLGVVEEMTFCVCSVSRERPISRLRRDLEWVE